MATVQQHLDQYGISVEMARDFIMDNLNNLLSIYTVCEEYGVTNDMIAEILNLDGISGTEVANYFALNGIDSNGLGGSSRTIDVIDVLSDGVITDIVSDGNYSGSYIGDQSGTFNFTINGDSVTGDWYNSYWNEYGGLHGSVNNETGYLQIVSSDEDGVPISMTGTISGESASGTWNMPYYGDGTFTANMIA